MRRALKISSTSSKLDMIEDIMRNLRRIIANDEIETSEHPLYFMGDDGSSGDFPKAIDRIRLETNCLRRLRQASKYVVFFLDDELRMRECALDNIGPKTNSSIHDESLSLKVSS